MRKISEPMAELVYKGKTIKRVVLSKAKNAAQLLANKLNGPVKVVLKKANRKAALSQAETAYENFHGEPPEKIVRRTIDRPDESGYKLGDMIGIAYETVRDGRKRQFFHEFSKPARPEVIVDANGKKAHMLGGAYEVTDRGFIDRKASK